jgi:hypothetical protein
LRAIAIVINVNPYRAVALFGSGIRYPLSVHLSLIFLLGRGNLVFDTSY